MWKCTDKTCSLPVTRLLLLMMMLAMVVACTPARKRLHFNGSRPPATLIDFAERLLTLHDQGETAMPSLMQCFEWEHVDATVREAVTRSLYFDLDTHIRSIDIEPWKPTDDDSFFGSSTRPNLTPEWVLHLHFETRPEQMLSLPVGKTEAGYRITNPVYPICTPTITP